MCHSVPSLVDQLSISLTWLRCTSSVQHRWMAPMWIHVCLPMSRKHKSQRGSEPAFMLGLSWLTGSSLKTNRVFVQSAVFPHSKQIRVRECRETEMSPVFEGQPRKQTLGLFIQAAIAFPPQFLLSSRCWSDCQTMTGPFETDHHLQPHTLSSVNERHCLPVVWIKLLLSTLDYSEVDE